MALPSAASARHIHRHGCIALYPRQHYFLVAAEACVRISLLVLFAILTVAAGYIARDMRAVLAGGAAEDQWL